MGKNFDRAFKVLVKCYNKTVEQAEDYLEKLDEVLPTLHRPSGDAVVKEDELSRISQIVFALDPLTGNPTSDISYLISSGDEGFKEYIKNILFKDNPQGVMAETPEEAAALVKKSMMTFSDYEKSLREYVLNNVEDGRSE